MMRRAGSLPANLLCSLRFRGEELLGFRDDGGEKDVHFSRAPIESGERANGRLRPPLSLNYDSHACHSRRPRGQAGRVRARVERPMTHARRSRAAQAPVAPHAGPFLDASTLSFCDFARLAEARSPRWRGFSTSLSSFLVNSWTSQSANAVSWRPPLALATASPPPHATSLRRPAVPRCMPPPYPVYASRVRSCMQPPPAHTRMDGCMRPVRHRD